jgi:superfamily I DNA/RNA helicase
LDHDQLHAERNRLWDMAYAECGDPDRELSFYQTEWSQVVQPQDVATRDDYLAARRVGRGVRLSRAQRAAAWKVFERYRELLRDENRLEWSDVTRETRMFIEKNRVTFPYRAVLADETQDFTPSDLKLLRAIVPKGPNDLFLVGDGHQRIYSRETRLGRCGIDIRGRSRRLKLNYRTTEEIRNRAVSILENCKIDDLDDGLDSLKGYKSLRRGQEPEVRHFDREANEAEFLISTLRDWIDEVGPETICVAARTRSQIKDRYLPLLAAADIPAVIVETDPETEAQQPGVRLATMHRMKGLEFKRVILAGVNGTTAPLSLEGALADAADDHEFRERCLFYVASTRARDRLVVIGFGGRSPFC